MKMLPLQFCQPFMPETFATRTSPQAKALGTHQPQERFSPTPQGFAFRPAASMGEAGSATSKLQALARDGVIQTAPPRTALKLRRGQLLADGSEGRQVRQLQRMLKFEGGKLRRDGIFGPRTERQVRNFQKKHHLKVDGIVGPKTLKVLNQRYLGSDLSNAVPEPKAKAVVAKTVAPAPAPAPEVAKTETRPTPKPATPDNFGLSAQTIQGLEKSGKMEAFRKLPAPISQRYGQLSAPVRQQLYQQLSGSTWGVSHRDAFVKGSAMGMDTFSMMGDKLKEAATQGKISQREAQQLQADMQRLRALTPNQRSLVAEVIMLQRGR